MTGEDELLRRSMNVAPEEWLDRLVSERVLDEVRQQCALRQQCNQLQQCHQRRARTSAEPEVQPGPPALASLAHGR